MGFGDYPAEYNPAKHGPYDPARFYGKRKYLNVKKFQKFMLIFSHKIHCILVTVKIT